MSKIFQDQEHLSKKISFPTTQLFLSMDLEGLRQKDDRNWFPMKPTAASPGAENKELFMRCWYLGVGELIFDEHAGIDRVAGVGRFLQLFIQLWRVCDTLCHTVTLWRWWKSHDVTVEHRHCLNQLNKWTMDTKKAPRGFGQTEIDSTLDVNAEGKTFKYCHVREG